MNQRPVLSAVVPCFNMGLYVEEAVESVLNQTYRSFEIVVVDDGSSDEATQRAFDRLAARQIPVVHQANLGLPQLSHDLIRP